MTISYNYDGVLSCTIVTAEVLASYSTGINMLFLALTYTRKKEQVNLCDQYTSNVNLVPYCNSFIIRT